MTHQEGLTTYLASFIEEMVQSGVTEVVISPGSRSTPIAMLLMEHPHVHTYINIDERSAAFFALGLAKQMRKPAAILCTSGTAAANYYPAIAEARISRVPLVVLTADRPHELREVGAPQAIDQLHLYGKHVKWFAEMPLPESGDEILQFVKATAARAVSQAGQAPAGPVHINFPLREPLIPRLEPSPFSLEEKKRRVEAVQGKMMLSEDAMKDLIERLQGIEKGLIVCGVIDEPGFAEAVLLLAKRLGYPVLADPLSQLRSGSFQGDYVIDNYDSVFKDAKVASELKPEAVIRFGGMPVSKPLTLLLKELHDVEHIVVDGGNGWRDPLKMATKMVYCDEETFCKQIASHLDDRKESKWLHKWKEINRIAAETITNFIEAEKNMDEGKVIMELVKQLPENSTVFVGNSMPIRDIDTFFHFNQKNIRVMANRGANGIDGVVSSALGASVYADPLFLIIGDLSFFHDMNGLLAAKMNQLNINIILINNNGGGIFSFLPQAKEPKHFETLFGTPTDLEFVHAVRLYEGRYTKVQNWDEFHSAVSQSLEWKGLNVVEIPTDRNVNVQVHREMWNRVSQEISEYLNGDET
jgi:2-succinyl-5-enolpyruvyl-6-hydroxy-3-cyclohexene-1-carboxylate synthase